jgi:hypothetical protein
MGLRYRKSINLGGGFRINISKSGIGYSWGGNGYRITKTAKGTVRTTRSFPGTGFSYVKEYGKAKQNKNELVSGKEKELGVGEITDYQSEYRELLDVIAHYRKWNRFANILLFTFLFSVNPIFIITGCVGIFLKIYVKKNLAIPIEFYFDDESREKYEYSKSRWKNLNKTKKLWQIITSSSVDNTRYHAGASNIISRKEIKISESCPPFFKTKEKFISIKLKNETLYFMPDKMFIVKGKEIGAISYNNLTVGARSYRFIENGPVPLDADVIGQTWQKVNKDGSPDKRFSGNRQIPVCRYGLITLQSDSGMDIRICCSNYGLLENF